MKAGMEGCTGNSPSVQFMSLSSLNITIPLREPDRVPPCRPSSPGGRRRWAAKTSSNPAINQQDTEFKENEWRRRRSSFNPPLPRCQVGLFLTRLEVIGAKIVKDSQARRSQLPHSYQTVRKVGTASAKRIQLEKIRCFKYNVTMANIMERHPTI